MEVKALDIVTEPSSRGCLNTSRTFLLNSGMRIPASLIINLVANGMSTEEILNEYPELESDDIKESLHYVSWLAKEEVHTVAR